jgi:DNA-directed RNA polymerase alpha subunit
MKSTKDKKEVFSKFEKKVAISILTGMSVSKCSKLFEIDRIMSQTILSTFCMKSNRFLYDKLQGNSYPWPAIGKLREHSEVFINDSKKLENVTIDSSIWALPDVPTMTLNAIWNRNNYTIKDLLQHSQRDLLRFKYFGRIGLNKLISSLNQYGLSIKK